MKPVAKGQKILPALSADWYNSTLLPPNLPPRERQGEGNPHNEHMAVFVATAECTIARRFTAVACSSPTDANIPANLRVERALYVNKENLNQHNWIITQADMTARTPAQLCVYSGITYAKVRILSPSHRFVTLVGLELVSSDSGKAQILFAGEEVSLINIGNFPSIPTTTTAPPNPPACTSNCKYIYQMVDGQLAWVLNINSCTTSTSTSTSTTTNTSSTTTQENWKCRAISTTTTVPCACDPPPYCGVTAADCFYSACTRSPRPAVSCTSTTTSTSTTSTSTTCDCGSFTTLEGPTTGPNGNCPPGCVKVQADICSPPSCECPPGPPPPPPCLPGNCSGSKSYLCTLDGWVYTGGICSWTTACAPANRACIAIAPTGACTCGVSVTVACQSVTFPGTTTTSDPFTTTTLPSHCSTSCGRTCLTGCPTTTTSTSTTTTPNCPSPCYSKWNGTNWVLTVACAANCFCQPHPVPGIDTCQIVRGRCAPTTTTTTTSSTSTSTSTTTSSTSTSTSTSTSSTSSTSTSSTTTTCELYDAYQCIDFVCTPAGQKFDCGQVSSFDNVCPTCASTTTTPPPTSTTTTPGSSPL